MSFCGFGRKQSVAKGCASLEETLRKINIQASPRRKQILEFSQCFNFQTSKQKVKIEMNVFCLKKVQSCVKNLKADIFRFR